MTQQKLWLEGQIVLIEPKHLSYGFKESFFTNSYRLIKLYSPKKVKEQSLHLYYQNEKIWELKLDEAGYFRATLDLIETINFEPNEIRYYLGDNKTEVYKPEYSKNNIYTIPDDGKIVVSDIDDTVLISHATSKWKKFTTLIKYSAFQRKQVEAMNQFFQQMNKEHGFIYLSNSEMNLYPLIKNFLSKYHFPKGPLFLREHMNLLQIFNRKRRSIQTKHHKEQTLTLLMQSYAHKKFILVGDSGQKDPEIYFNIAKMFKNQVETIYIREVSGSRKRKRLQQIEKELGNLGIKFILFNTGRNLLT